MNQVVKTKASYYFDLPDLLFSKIIPGGHFRKHGIFFNNFDCIYPLSETGSSFLMPLYNC